MVGKEERSRSVSIESIHSAEHVNGVDGDLDSDEFVDAAESVEFVSPLVTPLFVWIEGNACSGKTRLYENLRDDIELAICFDNTFFIPSSALSLLRGEQLEAALISFVDDLWRLADPNTHMVIVDGSILRHLDTMSTLPCWSPQHTTRFVNIVLRLETSAEECVARGYRGDRETLDAYYASVAMRLAFSPMVLPVAADWDIRDVVGRLSSAF
jgi:hypothetical protein